MKNFLWILLFLCWFSGSTMLFAQVMGLRADSPEAAWQFQRMQFESRQVQMQRMQFESHQVQLQTDPPLKIGYRENVLWETKLGEDLPRRIRVGKQTYFLSGTTATVEKIVGPRLCLLRFEDSSSLFYLQEYSTKELYEGMNVTLAGPIECTGIKYGHRVLKFISPSEMREKTREIH